MGNRPIRCAVMGQPPMRFPWGFDEEDERCRKMKLELAQQIMALHQRGVTQFLTACDCGVGLYAAEIVNALRTAQPEVMLLCYTPCEEQATKWAPALRERYFAVLGQCTRVTAVCPRQERGAQWRAYRRIIDLADMVLFVYDSTSAANGAEDRAFACAAVVRKPLLVLDPLRLTTQMRR